jgi:hypothetical protein
MVNTSTKKLSKSEFWALADRAEDVTYELISGTAIPKMSPKYFHSRSAGKIFMLLQAWATSSGRVGIEWAFELNDDSTPVPDLIYVSFDRLLPSWHENTACPVAPELAIEIISPGQTMEQMAPLSGGMTELRIAAHRCGSEILEEVDSALVGKIIARTSNFAGVPAKIAQTAIIHPNIW